MPYNILNLFINDPVHLLKGHLSLVFGFPLKGLDEVIKVCFQIIQNWI